MYMYVQLWRWLLHLFFTVQITSLKKQLAQKEQALIDKDKQVSHSDLDVCSSLFMTFFHFPFQICQLKAESLDKEKDTRQKLQAQQKIHSEAVDLLQVSKQ